jgi:uncharacterized protein
VKPKIIITVGLVLVIIFGFTSITKIGFVLQHNIFYSSAVEQSDANFLNDLARSAEERLKAYIKYDGSYFEIAYPLGDIPANKGVCTDVVIRSYRMMNIDLQELVHLDMSKHFLSYPKIWRLTKPDANIDHRRVPNLMTFFERCHSNLPITDNPSSYKSGHIVAWDLGLGTTHIGIVSNKLSHDRFTYKIIHNIGNRPQIENVLFKWRIIGHYNFNPRHLKCSDI